MNEVYFSIGSNLGDREANLRNAVAAMEKAFGTKVSAVSQIIETEPWGFDSKDKFLNCAVRFDIDASAESILKICKEIESEMGREMRKPAFDSDGSRVYTSRIIDIDIVLCGTLSLNTPELTIPHKSMKDRDFVMIPLKEILTPSIAAHFGI